MVTFTTLALLTLVLLGAGLSEAWFHRKRLSQIRVRVHVNGTRGKSSVTRLIAAGLRAGGIRTCAKTTGTLPRMIFPDGSELPIFRNARANVIEQKRVIAMAAREGAQALVVECMALQPVLQSLCELTFVRATHGVITNARPDHLDVMGPDSAGVARALSGTVPVKAKFFTAEVEHLPILEEAAKDRESQVICTAVPERMTVTDAELSLFQYHEHAENVALALAVCEDIGVERSVALKGMQSATPDPGAMTEHHVDFFGRKLAFFNAFAANDPVSTERLWRWTLQKRTPAHTCIAIFNCRGDRPDRSRQLAEAFAGWPGADWTVLMGTGTHHFARFATDAGIDGRTLIFMEGLRVEEIFERIIELVDGSAIITGMGNVGGQGLDLARYFRNRGTVQAK